MGLKGGLALQSPVLQPLAEAINVKSETQSRRTGVIPGGVQTPYPARSHLLLQPQAPTLTEVTSSAPSPCCVPFSGSLIFFVHICLHHQLNPRLCHKRSPLLLPRPFQA